MQDERFIVSYPQTGRGMMPAPAHRERMEFFWYLESLQGHCKDIINPYLITEKKKRLSLYCWSVWWSVGCSKREILSWSRLWSWRLGSLYATLEYRVWFPALPPDCSFLTMKTPGGMGGLGSLALATHVDDLHGMPGSCFEPWTKPDYFNHLMSQLLDEGFVCLLNQ